MEEPLRSLVGVSGVGCDVGAVCRLLLFIRPREISVAEAKRFVLYVVRLIGDLWRDASISGKVRGRLGMLLVYLAVPVDLLPDFIPTWATPMTSSSSPPSFARSSSRGR